MKETSRPSSEPPKRHRIWASWARVTVPWEKESSPVPEKSPGPDHSTAS